MVAEHDARGGQNADLRRTVRATKATRRTLRHTWQLSSAGFNPAWLSDTFSWASFGNGLVAILSGGAANYLSRISDTFTAPYATAIVLFAAAFFIIWFTWTENRRITPRGAGGGYFAAVKEALALILTGSSVQILTAVQVQILSFC
ncbi:MAG: hypothetical protein BJ554DRAFT_5102 [Olpidium bornovanus]|uniref:Uncharacterized protein n=1 Tax=Olpidium bornovanus TaxID=278681 RepID=A0A8H7ZJL8_9FUNG|nr:MAG: hypothetical protein BJ554DRAFT_5102 [Olpidium bornovanus]